MRHLGKSAATRSLLIVEPGDDVLVELDTLADQEGWTIALISGGGVLELVELVDADGVTRTLGNAEVVHLAGTMVSSRLGRTTTLRAALTSSGGFHAGRIIEALAGSLLLVVNASTEGIDDSDKRPARQIETSIQEPEPVDHTQLVSERRRRIVQLPEPVETLPADEPSEPPPEPEPEPAPFRGRLGDTMPSAESEPPPRLTFTGLAAEPPDAAAPAAAERLPISAPKPPSKTFRNRPIPRRIAASWLDEDEIVPEPGDYLDHPQLGRCLVEGEDSAGRTIIKVPSGRRRTLQLSALRVQPGEQGENGRQIYKILGPKPRR